MVELRDITWDNFWAVTEIKTKPEQSHYLPSPAVYMAQAWVNLKAGDEGACFAIYHNNDLVGFTKIELIPMGLMPFDFAQPAYYLDAFVIDAKHQGKGLGRVALGEVVSFMRSKPWGDVDAIKLSCYGDNVGAVALYESFGFVRTGDTFPDRNNKNLHIFELRG